MEALNSVLSWILVVGGVVYGVIMAFYYSSRMMVQGGNKSVQRPKK